MQALIKIDTITDKQSLLQKWRRRKKHHSVTLIKMGKGTLGNENTWCPGKSEATQQAPWESPDLIFAK